MASSGSEDPEPWIMAQAALIRESKFVFTGPLSFCTAAKLIPLLIVPVDSWLLLTHERTEFCFMNIHLFINRIRNSCTNRHSSFIDLTIVYS